MVKAKTDPSAPAAVVQLLDEIDKVGPSGSSDIASTSSGDTASEATALIAALTSLLERCFSLIFESEESDELSTSLKYGLDALRQWAIRSADLTQQVPLKGHLDRCRDLLFKPDHQLKLANVIWSSCSAERTQISNRSKALTEALIGLLHSLYHADTPVPASKDDAKQPAVIPFPQNSSFAKDLAARSFSQLERKPAPIILEIFLAKYGSAPLRCVSPTGVTYTDDQIYQNIIKGLGTTDGGANRRSRLALSFLQARADDLNCTLSKQALVVQSQNQAAEDKAWHIWTSIWLEPLCNALEHGGERLRSGLASYHLATLFDMDTRVFSLLLGSLMRSGTPDQDVNVEALFMTLRMGKTQGLCSISDSNDFASEITETGTTRVLVPAVLLKDCILSAASELQISTLSLVIESRTPALPFNPSELDILRTFFPYSLTISNPGARGELRGFFVKMLTRLRASSYALARDSSKITRIEEHERLPEEIKKLAVLQRDLNGVQTFLEWLYTLIRQTLHPGAPYQACITALTFLDLILESGIDPRFAQPSATPAKATDKTLTKNAGMTLAKTKQVFKQDFPFTLDLISPSLVSLLLSCSESTYDDIQNRALTMLARFPSPLPGLEDETSAASRILGKAAHLMTSTRDSESAVAFRLIQLYRTVYIQKLSWAPLPLLALSGVQADAVIDATTANHEIQLINDHLNFLSYHLSVAERGEILEAATSHPVHGTLVTLQELFATTQVEKLSESDVASFIRSMDAAKELVDRTWNVTKAVLCNSAPEGSVGEAKAEESATDGSAGLHQPTHESVRAMRLADSDEKADGLQQQQESTAGPKHQVILSYCWRGMKEASALLGALVASTLKPSVKLQQGLWTKDEVENVGSRFNLWLTQVRHRGAFSTIYPAYCQAAAAIVRSGWDEVSGLPRQWIQTFLEAVAQRDTTLSITRRSAGIGYAVLALVLAHPYKTDTFVLVETVERLIEISEQGVSNTEDNVPVSAIHALNVLRVLVSDGQLSEHMSPFVGRLIELTISRFSSKFWGLRNVSMMLFSSLCIRCFSSRNTNKDTKDARMPVDEFFLTHPNLDEFLRRTLAEKLDSSNKTSESDESSVFAVLMLFSRMQAPELQQENVRHAERLTAFANLIKKCASSTVWKIREMAAKAFASVVPLASASRVCVELLSQTSLSNQNQLHGTLLIVQRLMRSINESLMPPSSIEASMDELASILKQKIQTILSSNKCAVTQMAFLEVLQDFAGVRRDTFERHGNDILAEVRPWALGMMDLANKDTSIVINNPHGPSLIAACTRSLLQASSRVSAEAGSKQGFLSTCTLLLSHSVEDVRLSVVEAIVGDDAVTLKKSASESSEGFRQLVEFGNLLHRLISIDSESIWVRVNAAEILHYLLADDAAEITGNFALALFGGSEADVVKHTTSLTELVRATPCVPLREALLPVLADLCAVLHNSSTQSLASKSVVEECCQILSKCADEYESVQSREAAGIALRRMGRYLFPNSTDSKPLDLESASIFAARIAAIQLLTDDDEDVRIEAAAMFAETISSATSGVKPATVSANLATLTRVARSSGTSCEVSTDRAWGWMVSEYRGSTQNLWSQYVWQELVLSQSESEKAFDEAFSPSTMLFAEERPNQFRDPGANLRRAYEAVTSGKVLAPSENLLERSCKDIQKLDELLHGNESKTDAVAAHLLGERLVLAFAALQRCGFDHGDDIRDRARHISKTLGLDPSFSVAHSKEQTVPEEHKSGYSIAMVSDFFFPNVGGVEGHIFLVSQQLLELGHKVVVITHAYEPDRVGVRYLSGGLKVYYVPYKVIARQDTLPNFFSLFPLLRSILIREQIQIVHGHQALSSMAHEGILHARTLGLRTVFTDHSLFGFADAASILTNKLLRFALSDIDHVVCVSHTGKENTTLRANLDPSKVSVIPNAVVAKHFLPDPTRADPSRLTIVVLSRLMYRKGIDLLIAAIPRLCAMHPDLHFLIGGDGPKRVELEQMREKYLIQERVELVGAVRQGDVRAHLTRGQIFLNTSLTEAFGTSIIEAACTGLFVVSTKVGGIPEVLPPEMVRLARPEEDDVVRAMEDAIEYVRSGKHDPIAYHNAVSSMYSWRDVANRLERVYDSVVAEPFPSPLERFQKYYAGGPIAGKIFCIIVAVDMIFLYILEWFLPTSGIDLPPSLHDRQERRSAD